MTTLDDLRWSPKWVTHLGCVQGCLEFLGSEVTDAWLFGGTGHAFVVNIHEVVCPSGPTAWNTEMIHTLGRNVGFEVDPVVSHKSAPDFREKQAAAFKAVGIAIDAKQPCFGWELAIPEYYVVYGYDTDGYYYRGPQCDAGTGPKPWQELGDTGIGVLMVATVALCSPADIARTVKDAASFALEHAKSPSNWIFPKYRAGLEGFGLWIRALESGKADGSGVAYNAAVWSECRRYAAAFLREARNRLDSERGSYVNAALEHYEACAAALSALTQTFPFVDASEEQHQAHVEEGARVSKGLAQLRAARAAEERGLASLESIAKAL